MEVGGGGAMGRVQQVAECVGCPSTAGGGEVGVCSAPDGTGQVAMSVVVLTGAAETVCANEQPGCIGHLDIWTW